MLFVGGLTAYKLSPDVEDKTLYKSAQESAHKLSQV